MKMLSPSWHVHQRISYECLIYIIITEITEVSVILVSVINNFDVYQAFNASAFSEYAPGLLLEYRIFLYKLNLWGGNKFIAHMRQNHTSVSGYKYEICVYLDVVIGL